MMNTEIPQFIGCLEGHRDWVTAIKCPSLDVLPPHGYPYPVSSSRDKTVMVWHFDDKAIDNNVGYAKKALTGHSQAVNDVCLSSNGKFALSGSWDKTLRLWDVESGKTLRTFHGHTSDVLAVALSPDNRQIVSGSRDKTIKLWNTLAECKMTMDPKDQHDDWVSCLRFPPLITHDADGKPTAAEPTFVSCGWDKIVKVWNLNTCALKSNLVGHTSAVHAITVSPDGSLCASGGKDGVAMLWDVNESKHLYALDSNSTISALCFSPNRYWLCAATESAIRIWNLETKEVLADLRQPAEMQKPKQSGKRASRKASGIPWVTALTWDPSGRFLFAGSSDGRIYVYRIGEPM